MAIVNYPYAEGMSGKVKSRYLEKIQLVDGVDPFLLASSGRQSSDFTTVEAPELTFVTSQQLEAHKSLEVSGRVKYVTGDNQQICGNWRVSYFSHIFIEFLFYQSVRCSAM